MDGRLARNPLKGALGKCLACGDVRRGAQPAPDPGRAAASMGPIRPVNPGGYQQH